MSEWCAFGAGTIHTLFVRSIFSFYSIENCSALHEDLFAIKNNGVIWLMKWNNVAFGRMFNRTERPMDQILFEFKHTRPSSIRNFAFYTVYSCFALIFFFSHFSWNQCWILLWCFFFWAFNVRICCCVKRKLLSFMLWQRKCFWTYLMLHLI